MEEKGTEYKKDPLEWEEVTTEHLVKDQWIDIRKSSYRFPDGNVYEPFYTYSRKDFAVVAATDANGDYICVRQYRQGIGKVTLELPAGGIERTDGKEYGHGGISAEDALDAAKRELLEETGYESDDWTYLLTLPENATIADNYAYIFRARGCRRVSGQKLDDTEFLNVENHSLPELEKLIADGDFPQAIHIVALLLSRR